MLNSKLITFLFFIFSSNAFGYINQFALKAGAGVGVANLNSTEYGDEVYPGLSFTTNAIYKFTQFEVGLNSDIFLGSLRKAKFKTARTSVQGEASTRLVSFGPSFTWVFDSTYAEIWHPYITISPSLSIQTFKVEQEYGIDGEYEDDYKFLYHSRGVIFKLGIEEGLEEKSKHQSFFNLTYKYNFEAYEVSIDDTTNSWKVENLYNEKINSERVSQHIISFNLGITLF